MNNSSYAVSNTTDALELLGGLVQDHLAFQASAKTEGEKYHFIWVENLIVASTVVVVFVIAALCTEATYDAACLSPYDSSI